MAKRYHMPGRTRRVRQFFANFGWIWRCLRDGKIPRVWFPYGRGVSREALDWAGAEASLVELQTDTASFRDFDEWRAEQSAKLNQRLDDEQNAVRVAKKATGED